MDLLLIVLAAAAGTWILRVALIGLLPAERLPARLRRALDDVAPVVLAAMLANTLVAGGGVSALVSPALVAVLVAAFAAWRTSNLVVTVTTGILAYGLAGLLF
jgi:branched-subunit amino acid transport protein